MKHHRQMRTKTTNELKRERADAMSPDNIARHFARINHLMGENYIKEPNHVLNLDEVSFSPRDVTWGEK